MSAYKSQGELSWQLLELAWEMKIHDADVCVKHQVAKEEGGLPQALQANNKEGNDALHGERCTDGRKRVMHTTMMEESQKIVLQDSHPKGKLEEDSEDANASQSRMNKAGCQGNLCVVKSKKKGEEVFLPFWCHKLPDFACFQDLYAMEDSSTFASTLSLEQPQMGTLYYNRLRKKLFKWLIAMHRTHKLSVDTLHSSFQLFDRCMQVQPLMHEGETTLLCGTCLWIASKFCQNMKHLSIADMNMPGLRSMEVHILKVTGGQIHAPTPFSFTQGLSLLLRPSPALEAMAFYICDLFMMETDAIGIKPSSIAGACLIVAMRNIKPPDRLQHETSLPDMALVTRTPISQMNSLVGKVQLLDLLDFSVKEEKI